MASMQCKECHLKEQQRKPIAKCAACHADMGGLHKLPSHGGVDCATCHVPHRWSPEPRKVCLTCHADREQHNPGPACAQCHEFRPSAAKASATAGPPTITFAADPSSPGLVTFDHGKHLAGGAKCADCHPKLFAMKKGSAKLTMDGMSEGKVCGACHDGTKAFAAMDGDKCETCHKASGALK
jgi:c(7)-type cytochrome triheme protein